MSRFETTSTDGNRLLVFGIDHAVGIYVDVFDYRISDEYNQRVFAASSIEVRSKGTLRLAQDQCYRKLRHRFETADGHFELTANDVVDARAFDFITAVEPKLNKAGVGPLTEDIIRKMLGTTLK